jgi:hypothetical protein
LKIGFSRFAKKTLHRPLSRKALGPRGFGKPPVHFLFQATKIFIASDRLGKFRHLLTHQQTPLGFPQKEPAKKNNRTIPENHKRLAGSSMS